MEHKTWSIISFHFDVLPYSLLFYDVLDSNSKNVALTSVDESLET